MAWSVGLHIKNGVKLQVRQAHIYLSRVTKAKPGCKELCNDPQTPTAKGNLPRCSVKIVLNTALSVK